MSENQPVMQKCHRPTLLVNVRLTCCLKFTNGIDMINLKHILANQNIAFGQFKVSK